MKKWLIGLSVSLLVGAFVMAQDDADGTTTNPTVNVEALELFSGSILGYLQSRSASNPVEGGVCYEQTAELVASETSSADTTSADSTEGTSDDTTTDDGSSDSTTTDDSSDDSSSDTSNLADTNATYTCLVQILTSTGLADTLGAEGTFTVFAPTDDAFRRLAENMPASEFDALLADTATLTQVLNYHVLPEERSLSSLYTGAGTGSSPVTVTTVQGSDLTLTFENEPGDTSDDTTASTTDSNEASTQTFVRIGNNAASTADVEGDAYAVQETVDADNGYLIGIDHVLMPEDVTTQ